MTKPEIFTRTISWYELTPTASFIYQDKITKLWFVIERVNSHLEIQGASYALITAYRRYCDECYRLKTKAKPLDSFAVYDKLERVAKYKVYL